MVFSSDHCLAVGTFGSLHGSTTVCDHIVVAIGTLVPVPTRQPDGFYDEFELLFHPKLLGQLLSKL